MNEIKLSRCGIYLVTVPNDVDPGIINQMFPPTWRIVKTEVLEKNKSATTFLVMISDKLTTTMLPLTDTERRDD